MKIGIDGVLLGSWINHPSPKNILDVGTGSGLIALMLAQKFQKSNIHCVEIENDAIEQAVENFKNSPFNNSFTAHKSDFLDYNSNVKFEIIASNLPYYNDGGVFDDHKRDLARSSKHLPLMDFLNKSYDLLHDLGSIYFVYPNDDLIDIEKFANQTNLQIDSIVNIQGNPNSKVKRCLFQLSKKTETSNSHCTDNKHLTIEIKRGEYTAEYKSLCRDFYLKF